MLACLPDGISQALLQLAATDAWVNKLRESARLGPASPHRAADIPLVRWTSNALAEETLPRPVGREWPMRVETDGC
jgi:hypothetical protein